MIEVKKSLALLAVVFLILNNLALAQYPASSYEGRAIDPSKEGIDYYREGNVIVYPAKMGSEEERMMERFSKGDISEEEMRAMAKSKLGNKFDEMEFQRGLLEFKERMDRKEAFSYEHKGYGQSYYISPSYEGYSKEHMVFGMIFRHIGEDIDPREIKQYCNEPEKVADIVIEKLKGKFGDVQKVCSQAEEEEAKCEEHSRKGCSQLGVALVREDASEIEKLQAVAYSCPPNKDAIIEACKKRSKHYMEQRLQNIGEECKKRFDFEGERLLRECERFRESNVCDKDKFIERCMGGIKKEDFERKCPEYPVPACGEGSVPKTKTDANGCAYYYCEAISQCPTQSIPQCIEGSTLQKKTDEKGCVYYNCEAVACTADVQQCPDGSYVARDPAKNCEFKQCPTTICPEAVMPTCQSGQTLQKKTDEKGCIYYYCEAAQCPTVQKPICAADEYLQSYYDNAGCVTSYQCIRQTTCPTIEKPTCAEGQSMTTKYDDKGCIVGYECVSVATTGSAIKITGQVVLNTYEDFLKHCENSWNEQHKICSNIQQTCDKSSYIERCKEQERKNYADFVSQIERNCMTQTIAEVRHAEERCSRIDEERQRCFDESTKRCSQMKGLAQNCRDFLNEEKLRDFIVEEAKKRCKFTGIIEDEDDVRKAEKAEIVLAVLNTATESDVDKLELFVDDLREELKLQDTTVYKGMIEPNRFGDVKLLPFVVNAKISTAVSAERAKEVKAKIVAGQKAEEAAGKLVSLRDSDVPKEYLYIIEDKASDILDVSDSLEGIEKKDEQKGIGYKIRLFLGLAKKAEEVEIRQLDDSKSKLKNSIDVLTKLADEVPSDVAKAILKEQVENLKQQQSDIEVLIETKAKKAKGLFGVFG